MNGKNIFFTNIVIILTLLTLFFWTKTFYFWMQESLDKNDSIVLETKERKELLDKLNELKKSNKINKTLEKKFYKSFNENEILNFFYNHTNNDEVWIKINSISINKWSQNSIWFIEWEITLWISVRDEESFLTFLTFLNNSREYQFYLNYISYPMWNTENGFNINLPIKVFYKQA